MLSKLRALRARLLYSPYGSLMPMHLVRLVGLSARNRAHRGRYRTLSTEELLRTRSSDTAFVFGSGRSLLELGADEWEAISGCNTVSLREFPRQQWVRADYHLTSEVDSLDEYASRLRENPRYAETVFVVQGGFTAQRGNELIGRALLRDGARVYRYRRAHRARYADPSRTPRVLVHGYNSIFDATNFAYALGYRRIVLVGADYYNKEYFWLEAGETRTYEAAGIVATARWPQAEPIVQMMGRWRAAMAGEGVELSVYNPRSLLARELPVFRF